MRGIVNARLEAIIRVLIRGPEGAESEFDAIIDTGFSSSLTLPAAAVSGLGLVRVSSGRAVLADGSVRQHDFYNAEVKWDGSWRGVLISTVGNEVLLGMRLLAGHDLRVSVEPGGVIEIAPLPLTNP